MSTLTYATISIVENMLASPDLIHENSQHQRLTDLLPEWFAEIPLYQATAPSPGLPVMDQFHQLPLITKKDIRRNFPKNFLRSGVELSHLTDSELIELEHTSGTSEARTPLLLELGWWARQEERALRLNSIIAETLDAFPNARRVTISSPVCSNDICYTGVPTQSDRTLGNTLYTSLSRQPFLWSQVELERMAREACEWDPVFLDVDPVYGVLFARYCESRGIQLPSLRFIICSYEFVSIVHRQILERAFRVPVFNLYGSTETGHLLMENERGEMVPSLDTAYLELHDCDSNSVGDLVVTTLSNSYMPLIRYRIGDLAQRTRCHEGARYTVHGRAADAFKTAGGRRATTLQIDRCFEELAGFTHYQLLQATGNEYLLRFVPDQEPPTDACMAELKSRVSDQLQSHDIKFRLTDALMPEGSGKFRLGYPFQNPNDIAQA